MLQASLTHNAGNLTISSAINAGLAMIEKPRWKQHQRRAADNGFIRYLTEKQPDLNLWTDLVPGHIHELVQWMEKERGWSGPTVNNYLNPVRKASAYVQLYHPNQWVNLFVRRMRRKSAPKAHRYLMADQLATAINEAQKANDAAVLGAFWFCGFAGLGITEYLQIQREDIQADGLWVRAEKNGYRPRLLPMCEPLQDFAKSWGRVFSHVPLRSAEALSHRARVILNNCAESTGDESFRMVDLHEATRPSFANLALHSGCEAKFVQAYLGHAPQEVFEKHYADLVPTIKDMPRLREEKIAQMRERVTRRIDEKLIGTSLFS